MSPILHIDKAGRITFLTGLLLALFLAVVYLSNPSSIQNFNNKSTDAIQANADIRERTGSIVIVDIDDESLDQYGQWPWPRYRLAELLERVQQLGAGSIGLNMVFAEPDRSSPRIWQDTIREELGHTIDIEGVPRDRLDHDAVLAETLSKGPFVLGYEFLFGNRRGESLDRRLHPMSIVWVKKPDPVGSHASLFVADDVICNLGGLSESVSYSGFLNATPDSDGMLRRVPMVIKYGDGYFPSIALATLMQAEGSRQVLVEAEKNGQQYLLMNDRAIPLDDRGNLLVNFSLSPKGGTRISAANVLGGSVPPEAFRDKIVFVSASASGLGRDYQTPCCHTFPEAEVHSQVVEAVLTENFIFRNREAVLWEVALGMGLAVLYCFSLVRYGVIVNTILGSLLIFGTWQSAVIMFRKNGVLLSPLLPSLVISTNFIALTIFKYWKKHHGARKEVENALVLAETNENTLNSIVNTIPDIVYRLDDAGRITFVSRAISVYGQRPDDLLGRSILDLVPHEERGLARYRINERRMGKRATRGFELQLLLDLPQLNDTMEMRYFSISAEGIYRTGKPGKDSFLGTQGIARDITEKKQLENRLIQAKKMEIVAALAGGVAHDLNNILTNIVSYPDLLLLDMPKENPHETIIKSIRKSGEKAAEIVQDLLTLARRGVAVEKIICLNTVVQEYLHSPEYDRIRRDFPDVVIRTEPSEDLLNIKGSPVHIFKVVMNLVNNAAEAMPAGGEIILQTKTAVLDAPIDGYTTIPGGEYCRLSVMDNGVGISKEDVKQIFEPYFTKKQMGKSGSGLGMTVVWVTMQDHGGYVNVKSREGAGTRFDLYFPATHEVTETTPTTRVALDDYTGSERILVVDDSPMQQEISSKMLGKLGYTVALVSSGGDAVQYLKETGADLIILDLGGGMDGLDTYNCLAAEYPKQKIIIVTGFPDPEHSEALQKLGAAAAIKKPFSMEQIGLAVRKELDRTF
jgi:two-component system, cell cycle sensor histidine kinase and response regulator CckA